MISIGDELVIVTPTATSTATPPPTQTRIPTQTPTYTPTSSPVPSPQALSKATFDEEPTATPLPAMNQFLASAELGQIGLVVSVTLLALGLLAIVFVWRRIG